MKKINLYGGGGHCFAVVALIRSLGEYRPQVIFDDAPKQDNILEVPLRKYSNEELSSEPLFITVGNNGVRKRIASTFDTEFPTFIHPSVVTYPSASIGMGSVVLPNAVIDAGVKIGDFCIVNNNATVSHNVHLHNYVHIAIQAAITGGVTIGEGSFIGSGAIILPEITIGKWAVIGAGSVVTKNVPDGAVVYGNPAKIIKYNRI
jgi:acetyltransferase EpsM